MLNMAENQSEDLFEIEFSVNTVEIIETAIMSGSCFSCILCRTR
ncbi:hypothetical protein [Fluviispira vulneris]|nr:hypothetical protein [Fluviispira vulneris]